MEHTLVPTDNAIRKAKDSDRVKRKRVVLNFFQRQEVFEKIKQGISHEKIAEEYNIGLSTLSEVKKKYQENINRYQAENSLTTEKKVFKISAFPNLDQALKAWYYQERAKGISVTHVMLQHKAKVFYDLIYTDPGERKPFQASHGYIGRFCKRYSIEPVRPAKTIDEGCAEFAKKISILLTEYSLDQIYCADEFGLNYISLPYSANLALPTIDDRITLMACVNATASHKLPLLFIHKVQNPYCFVIRDGANNKTLDKSSLPVAYYHNKHAWATQEIFIDWFHAHFVPKVREHLVSINLSPRPCSSWTAGFRIRGI